MCCIYVVGLIEAGCLLYPGGVWRAILLVPDMLSAVFIVVLCYYIRQRSWANVMYSSPFVCLSVCLFVCLSVSRITQKVMDGFERNIMGR